MKVALPMRVAVAGDGAVRLAARQDQRPRSSACSGCTANRSDQVTAEDLHLVVAEAATAGVLEESERAIISGVVRLADRPTREVMTPRTEVDWIDVDADQATIRRKLLETPHSRIPGRRGLGRQARRRRPGARHRHRA